MTDGSNEQVIAVPTMGPGHATDVLVRVAQQQGYACVATGPATFRVARTYRPRWATIAAIATALFVGVGLLFLLVKRTVGGVAAVIEDREGTKVRLVGLNGSGLDVVLRSAFAAAPATVGAGAPVLAGGIAAVAPAVAPVTPPVAFAPPAVVPPSPMPPVAHVAPATFAPPPARLASPSDVLVGGTRGELDAERTVARRGDWRAASPAVSTSPALVRGDQVVTIGSGVVLGRDPVRDPAAADAVPVRVDDPSVSKTHATVGPTATGIWVIDHHSTNGTAIGGVHGSQPCPGGVRVDVGFGAELRVGDVVFRVRGGA